ncbi:unnamed protein product [Cuscuta campestris]|uniref:SWIRM domain-containing protein n=1 Tax=Cuscuta campestris TaxID=132261 RepID=A0A484N510_9ASTE|nr:unnamed protein product [Cuscuta campestris]
MATGDTTIKVADPDLTSLPPPPPPPQQETPPLPQLTRPESSPIPSTAAPIRSITAGTPTAIITSHLPETDVINVPSYSRWFSWNSIHEGEIRLLPEFFDGGSASKNPRVYKYYRNTIIRRFRENPTRKVSFTEVRKTLVGDVGSIRRVFDFLETWGLINYSGSTSSKTQLKWEDKEASRASFQSSEANATSMDIQVLKKRLCSGCKTLCSISCFLCDKYDMVLCAKCYVRGNYRVGLSSSDFRKVDLNEETKTDWSEKETLLLLEAVTHFGDDWKKVAGHVGGRSEKECVSRFIKLSFGEQFVGPPESAEMDYEQIPSKRTKLTPLADASNPIMAQAAFLSALAGTEVVEVATHAALKSLSEFGMEKIKRHLESLSASEDNQDSQNARNDQSVDTIEGALAEAQMQLDREEHDLESAISLVAVLMKEIEEKLVHFEEIELQTEKETHQLQQLQNQLFADQLNLIFNKAAAGEKNLAMNNKSE